MRHRSVTAAADELSMSPSACSHALARLRLALADDLFIRAGNTMVPTIHAEELARGVSQVLNQLNFVLSPAVKFQPESSTQTFVFAATDFTSYALLPLFISKLESQAPNIEIQVVYSTHYDSVEDLIAGKVHFALGYAEDDRHISEQVEVIDCFTDDYVVVSRSGHPRIGDSLTLEVYMNERHVVVTPWRDSISAISKTLKKNGLTRKVAVRLPSMMAAPFIVAQTNYLMTMPRRVALQISCAAPLSVYDAPFPSPMYGLKIYTPKNLHQNDATKWMKEQLISWLGVPREL